MKNIMNEKEIKRQQFVVKNGFPLEYRNALVNLNEVAPNISNKRFGIKTRRCKDPLKKILDSNKNKVKSVIAYGYRPEKGRITLMERKDYLTMCEAVRMKGDNFEEFTGVEFYKNRNEKYIVLDGGTSLEILKNPEVVNLPKEYLSENNKYEVQIVKPANYGNEIDAFVAIMAISYNKSWKLEDRNNYFKELISIAKNSDIDPQVLEAVSLISSNNEISLNDLILGKERLMFPEYEKRLNKKIVENPVYVELDMMPEVFDTKLSKEIVLYALDIVNKTDYEHDTLLKTLFYGNEKIGFKKGIMAEFKKQVKIHSDKADFKVNMAYFIGDAMIDIFKIKEDIKIFETRVKEDLKIAKNENGLYSNGLVARFSEMATKDEDQIDNLKLSLKKLNNKIVRTIKKGEF